MRVGERLAWWGTAVVAALSVVAACNDGDDDDDGGSDLCAQWCELPVEAGCPNADSAECRAQCNQPLADPSCRDELDALMQCTLELSPEDYWCNDDGNIVLSDGRCPEEVLALYQSGCVESDADAGALLDAAVLTDASYEWGCLLATSTAGDQCTCVFTVLPEDASHMTDACDSSFGCCHSLEFEDAGSCTCTLASAADCAPPDDNGMWVAVSSCPPP